jgi:hypothetical protein
LLPGGIHSVFEGFLHLQSNTQSISQKTEGKEEISGKSFSTLRRFTCQLKQAVPSA